MRETVNEDTKIFRNVANSSPNDTLLMFLLLLLFVSSTAVRVELAFQYNLPTFLPVSGHSTLMSVNVMTDMRVRSDDP
jgi:hypothetical protein